MARVEATSPAVALRKLRLGDSWSYSVAGSLASPDGGTLPLTGEIEVSIVPDELPGRAAQMAIQFSQNFEVLQPDGARKALPAPTWMFSIVQDPDSADVAALLTIWGPAARDARPRRPRSSIQGAGRAIQLTAISSTSITETM